MKITMKTRLILWLLSLALLVPVAAFAQQERQNELPLSVTVPPAIRKKLRETAPFVSLEVQGVSSEAALSELLLASKFNYVFDNAFYQNGTYNVVAATAKGVAGAVHGNLNLPPRVITMRLVDVPLDRALDTITQAIGVGWTVGGDAEPLTLRIVKLKGTVLLSDMVGQQGGLGGGGFGGGGGFSGGGFGGGAGGAEYGSKNENLLPEVRVKLDSKQISVRDALSETLKQGKIDFSLDDDVSSSEKRAFTFENVRLATALNAITESANLGWRVESIMGKGILVRVGKRYAPPSPAR